MRNSFFKYLLLRGVNSASRSELETETLPYTFNSNSHKLRNYRIYGNTVDGESVGDLVTEGEHTGEYCVEIVINMFNVLDTVAGKYITESGIEADSTSQSPQNYLNHTPYIRISPLHTYTFKCTLQGRVGFDNTVAFCWFDKNKNIISRNTEAIKKTAATYALTYTAPANAEYLIVNFIGYIENAAFILRDVAKNIIHIDEPLGEGEYIDFAEQKRYPSGDIIQIPTLPTTIGTNILSVATTVQPSKVYLQGRISEISSVSSRSLQANVRNLQPFSMEDDDFTIDESDLKDVSETRLEPDILQNENIGQVRLERGDENAE